MSNGSLNESGITVPFGPFCTNPLNWDWVQGSWDPNGTPYNITGSIKHNVNTIVVLKDLIEK